MYFDLSDKIRLLFRKEKEPYLRLKGILGFYPHNIELYKLALKHKSIAHFEREEMRAKGEKIKRDYKSSLNNERLEFLGDAILGAIVADILYRHYGTRQEGFLTNLRSKIVCRNSLGELAVKIGLDKLILHASANTCHNSYMNGNAFEAFLGAIYLDRGYTYCYRFIERLVAQKHINIEKAAREEKNAKSSLIEWCQRYQYKFVFRNREIREGSSPKFLCDITIEGVSCESGEGYSKKESDQNAAKQTMRRIKNDAQFRKEIQESHDQIRKAMREQSIRDKAANKLAGRDTLIFDLDGTLLDTLQDLFISTNHALRECGYAERTIEEVRQFVGNGVGMLIRRAIGEERIERGEVSQDEFEACLDVFKRHYVEHCRDNTSLYPGIQEMLVSLRDNGYKLAIVSNKLQSGVTELAEVWFKDYLSVAIGESEGISRKPAPDMVHEALRQLETPAGKAIYIGDSDVDIKTAEAAALPCVSVLWGFRDKAFLKEHGASILVETPEQLLAIVNKDRQTETKKEE